ncbi:ANTAR domain-containing protein [Nocardia sp. NPDC049707]|uniref:ANTAR domain-containing protein n=1 Tax=Nocardia sp. NPDC049707 TaxID=3154735 RepID=UPI0034238B52
MIGTGAGYYIDVAVALEERQQESLDDAPELYAARAVIEHAKGALMLDGINAEQAFRVLSWRSQETNIELRDLATRLIADLGALTDSMAELRTRFDHLLLTAQERIEAD